MVAQKEYLLAICIPTYNRAEQLRQFLKSLLPQIPAFKNYVGVFISDNASTDDTETMVREMASQYSVDIKYHRKHTHTDRFENYRTVMSLSQSKYVFMSGDDDIMAPNFLQTIMPYLLSSKEYGLIHWNYIGSDETCYRYGNLRHSFYKEQIEYTVSDFIRETISGTDFLSSVIFNRRIIDNTTSGYNDIGGGYSHFYNKLIGALQLNLPCIYYSFPLCIQRNPTRTNDAKLPYYLFVNQGKIWRELDSLVPGVYQKFKSGMANFPDQYLLKVALNKPFYMEHKKEMLDNLITPAQVELFEIALTAPNINQALLQKEKKKKILYKISKILRKLGIKK